jgi:hypothetical protein
MHLSPQRLKPASGWLISHDWILANADSPWAYMWWAYINGGDARYAAVDEMLLEDRPSTFYR